jgi:guanylate kinase
MDLKNEKCIIIGKTGSGKTHLMNKLIGKGLKPCLKWTTRPPRKFENQFIDYNFVSDMEFNEAINENNFLSYQKFEVTPDGKESQTWYYGITQHEFENSQVLIMTPGEFNEITAEQRKGCFVVYLDIDRSVRESRLFRRDDKNDSIKRRLDADEIDFSDFNDYDLKVRDPEFTADDVWDLMD